MSTPRIPALTEQQLAALPARERRAYLLAAEQVKQAYKRNPLLSWFPYESPRKPGWSPQAEYLASHADIKAFFGGNGTGKTDIGTVDDLIQLCDRDAVPEHLQCFKRWEPPFYLRVVAPKMNVIESTILEKFRKYVPRDQLKGGSFDRAFSKQFMQLHFKNGSWVLFNTSDQDRDAHAGVELHRVRFDEEPEWGIYLENTNRLRAFNPSQLCFTMTPSLKGSMGWTYDEVWERRDDPDVFCVTASMLDNPHIHAEQAMQRLKNASEAERAAMIDGKFIALRGRVLHAFDADRHVVDPPSREHVQMLDCYVGIDPGIARGGVVWCGFDRDNHMLVFDELYPEDQTVPQIADAIRERNAFWGIKRPVYIIDPSQRNRSLTTGESVEGEFQRAGIYAQPGQNERDAGILQLRARTEAGSLLVSRQCSMWLREADRYVLVDDEVTREGDPKGKGSSGNRTAGPDHLMDPCLVPGTMVATEHGEKPIERVEAGERVWTRDGLKTVEVAWLANPDAEVFTLTLEDGRTLSGTGHHPVWVEGRGWVRLDAIRYGDILTTCREPSNPSSSTASSSAATPTPSSAATASTSHRAARTASAASAGSTRRSGSTLTARFRRAATSITSMAIRSTTTWRTSSASRPASTPTRISTMSGVTSSAHGSTASARSPLHGTPAPKAWHGTPSTPIARYLRCRRSPMSASSAARSTRLVPSAPTASAPTAASPRGGELRALTTRTELARSAEASSASTATARPSLARVRALGVARAGRSAVYDLQVEGSPEFFANGVLTHNTRYVAMERVWYLRPDGQHVEPWSLASGRMPTREQWRAMHRPTAALMGKYS